MQKKKEKFQVQSISLIIHTQPWYSQMLFIFSKKMLEYFFLILNTVIDYKQENHF
jgi:hypothetical protein